MRGLSDFTAASNYGLSLVVVFPGARKPLSPNHLAHHITSICAVDGCQQLQLLSVLLGERYTNWSESSNHKSLVTVF